MWLDSSGTNSKFVTLIREDFAVKWHESVALFIQLFPVVDTEPSSTNTFFSVQVLRDSHYNNTIVRS